MSEELSDYIEDNNCSDKVPNTELIYKYTESVVKSQAESLNRLDTKLSGFLAFTGVLVRFIGDLSGKMSIHGLACYACIFLTFLAYISLGVSALLLCLGLTARLRVTNISPKILMKDKWYYSDSNEISDFIVSAWIEAEAEYEQLGLDKERKLNIAIQLIAVALVSIIINALIKVIWGE
jgi:hypothetical protein